MKKLNISPIDTYFANGSYPIEFLFYFRQPLRTIKIRKALKQLSSEYWPAFGEYDDGVIRFEKYHETDFFEEVKTEDEFEPSISSVQIFQKYRDAIPSNLTKLFFIKIIQLSNGTVFIARMNHLAGDGYSYFYLLSVLAAISRDYRVPFQKYFTRLITRPHHHRNLFGDFIFSGHDLKPIPAEDNLTIIIEEISREEIRKIIRNIISDSHQTITTNDLLSAMIIKKTLKQNIAQFKNNIELTMPVDVRPQIKGYGPKFFGNGLLFKRIQFYLSDVTNSDFESLAAEIRKNMPVITVEDYKAYQAGIVELIQQREYNKLTPYDPASGCLVTNLSRLPVSRLDFGSGTPDFIFPLTIGRNSAAMLANEKNFILRLVY